MSTSPIDQLLAGFAALPFSQYLPSAPIAMTNISADELCQGLHSLPQELYDKIFSLVFQPDSNRTKIDKHYTPPVQLQINHSTRAFFLKNFYGNGSEWLFDNRAAVEYFLPKWYRWLPKIIKSGLRSVARGGNHGILLELDEYHDAMVYQTQRTGVKKPLSVVRILPV